MTTAAERLEEVRQAISKILTEGQRVRRGDRELQRAELASLRILEEQYKADASAEAAATRGRNRISYVSI